jgi:hypothetical protein
VGIPIWVTTSDAVPFFFGSLVTTTDEPSFAFVRQVMRRSVPLTFGSPPATTSRTVASPAANASHLSMSSSMRSVVDLLTLSWKVPSDRCPGIRRPMCCS